MNDAGLKAHIEVLSVAVASLAIQAQQTVQVNEALKALLERWPDLADAADALKLNLARLQEEQRASDWIGRLSHGF